MRNSPGESVGVGVAFSLVAALAAAAMVPLRATLGSANTALIMVLVVVAAASIGGRAAGAITAVSSSVAFNFFHTKPYLTVRIDSARDVLTVVLILATGLSVGQLGVARTRQSATRRSHLRAIRSLEDISALVNAGASSKVLWPAVRSALVATLGLRDARYETDLVDPTLPVFERDGSMNFANKRYLGAGFALPVEGAALNIDVEGVRLGQIIVVADPAVGVTREQRRAAVAIADQFALVLRDEHRGRRVG
jgi:K+-sensing histidine kinase KdpD